MKITYFFNLLKKIKKNLPGNKYEKSAIIDIMTYQIISFSLSIFLIFTSFYFNEKIIYTLVFLYPLIPVGKYAIPIVLQEPNQPNRYNALSAVFTYYIFLFTIVLLFTIITLRIDFKITFFCYIFFYIISIYSLINQIKKSSDSY